MKSLKYTMTVVLIGDAGEKGEFTTAQANAIYNAVKTCWSTQVFVPELGHRFWRLTLQVMHISHIVRHFPSHQYTAAIEPIQNMDKCNFAIEGFTGYANRPSR